MKTKYIASGLALLTISIFGSLPVFAVTVANTNDSGPGSLRQAMESSADLIDFAPVFFSSPQTISLESRLPPISRDLWIFGPGADLLTIDGQFRTNNQPLITIFSFSPVVRLEGFTLTGGYDPLSTGNVGGIFTRGKLTLANIAIDNNRGTGVFNQGGTLKIINSTISDNTKEGLVNQGGNATIINSTIAHNGTSGVFNQVGDLAIYNSTVAQNSSRGVGSTIFSTSGSLRIESTILADNGQNDLSFNEIPLIRNNLIENGTGIQNGIDGNIVGFDPLLGPLAFNGGGTRTILPQAGSLAIDAGTNPLATLQDQRGFNRLVGSGIDIGSVETVPEPSTGVFAAIAAVAFVNWTKRRRPTSGGRT